MVLGTTEKKKIVQLEPLTVQLGQSSITGYRVRLPTSLPKMAAKKSLRKNHHNLKWLLWVGDDCWSSGARSDTQSAGSGWCHSVGWAQTSSLGCPDVIECHWGALTPSCTVLLGWPDVMVCGVLTSSWGVQCHGVQCPLVLTWGPWA